MRTSTESIVDFVHCPFFNEDNVVRLTYTKCYSMLYYCRGVEDGQYKYLLQDKT